MAPAESGEAGIGVIHLLPDSMAEGESPRSAEAEPGAEDFVSPATNDWYRPLQIGWRYGPKLLA